MDFNEAQATKGTINEEINNVWNGLEPLRSHIDQAEQLVGSLIANGFESEPVKEFYGALMVLKVALEEAVKAAHGAGQAATDL